MENKAQNRRDWVKNIAIIFLVILLLLTFFSRTIMNARLPEVSAQYAQYATLSAAVKASGTVKANESYNVIFEEKETVVQSRKVQSVYVKAGDYVEMDAPILALTNDPSQQLKDAREELAEAKETYQKLKESGTVETLTSDKKLNDAQREIEKAEDKLKTLEAEYKSVLAGGDPATVIKDAIKSLNDQIKQLEQNKKDARKELETNKKNSQKDLEQQKKQSQKNYDAQISAVDSRISELNTQISEVSGKLAAAEAVIEDDVLSQETVWQKAAAAENFYNETESAYQAAKEAYDAVKADADLWQEKVDAINLHIGDVEKANTLTNQIKGLQETLDGYDRQAQRAREDYEDTVEEYIKARDDAIRAADEAYYDGEKSARAGAEKTETVDMGEGEEPQTITYFDQAAYMELMEPVERSRDKTIETAWRTYNEQVETLTKSYDRSVEDLQDQIDKAQTELGDAQAKLYVIDMPEVDDVIQYEFGYDLGEAQSSLEKATAAVSEAEAEMQKAQTARDDAKTRLESLQKQTLAEGTAAGYRAELNGLKAQLEANESARKQYEEARSDSGERFDDSISDSNDRYDTQIEESDERYDSRIEALRDKITEKNDELNSIPQKRSADEVKKEIEEQKELIDDLKSSYEITENSEDNTTADRQRELDKAEQQVKEMEERVKEYEEAEVTLNVTAPIAGKIVAVNHVPGDTLTSGESVASIEIADKGYVVEITMSAEEARKIQTGSPVTVTNSWWYSNISASIAQVKSDPQSQGRNRIIVMNVSGDVSEGQTLNFSIGDRSQSYDSVLPNSAIREDTEGKFVLTVEAKKTPLGTRYTARRTVIEVLASDDTQSAVSGLYGSEFVITSSTTPISDGQQVRLAGD